jgi:hypothetical protein
MVTLRIPVRATLVAAVLILVTLSALWTMPRLDSTPAQAQTPGAASEGTAPDFDCGPALRTVARTKPTGGNTYFPGTTFVTIPDLVITVPVVASASDCFLVTFSSGVVAAGSDVNDRCFIRAVANGSTMFPRTDHRLWADEANAHLVASYQWMHRLTPGSSAMEVKLQWRGSSANTACVLTDWTLLVQRFD